MSAILGFILIIIVIILVIGFSIIRGVLRLLFGFGRKQNYQDGAGTGSSPNRSNAGNTKNENTRKKIFDKDEGEYVDFEEVNEK